MEQGPVATEAPPLAPTALQVPPSPSDPFALDPGRSKSLKRTRETTPTSPTSNIGPGHVSPAKAARLAHDLRLSPAPLTAAAALDEQRRQREEEQRQNPPGISESPAHKILAELMSGTTAPSSRVAEAPMDATAVNNSVPALPNHAESRGETSPQSATSAASMAGAPVTESPTAMDIDLKNDPVNALQQSAASEERTSPGSLSYPGSLQTNPAMPAPPRGNSFPMPLPGQSSPTSTSGKKHKCPYCETEFTRHHNLKSHLLTHSQEKPYVCSDCQMRFRRLHDLKRHSKLHTGEKPHICPKCDRKFARGDALARHSKGAGGCAGRRSSMGSFADGDDLDGPSMTDGDDSTMAGVSYSNEDELTEEERRRRSLPSIQAQHVAGSQASPDVYSGHGRTYPPAGSARAVTTGGLYPPNVDRGNASANTSPSMPNSITSGHASNASISSMPMSAGSSSMYSQSGMTESPKPLSPAALSSNQLGHDASGITRQRSPSLTQQFQQQHYGRRPSEKHSPPGLSLPSPHGTTHGPKLPALTNFAQPDSRLPPGQVGAPAVVPPGSHSRNSSGHQPGTNSDSASNMFASDPGVWAYIQSLEEKVKQLAEKVANMEKAESSKQAQIIYLTSEVTSLRKTLEAPQEPEPPSIKA
jgi:hypothetical protein